MATNEDVNVGLMDTPVHFLCPELSKSSSGENVVIYLESGLFQAHVEEHDLTSAKVDEALTSRDRIVVTTWTHRCANIEYRLRYRGLVYDIDRIKRLENGLYSRYECSKEIVER